MKQQVIGTGLSGLVGSRIVELLESKYKFIDFSYDSGVDITDFNLLKKKFLEHKKTNSVIHLAAFTDVNAAWKQNKKENGICFKVNVLGTKNIAQLCAKTGKNLVHISTDFVFDGESPPEGGYTEEDKPNPIEWYGKTKYLAEKEVEKSGCDYIILRIAFPFKAKPSPKNLEPQIKLDLIRKVKKKLAKGETIDVFANQIITPTFIDDIVKVVDDCFKNKLKGIYHCVGSTHLSPYKMAIKIAERFNLDKNLIKKASFEDYLKEMKKNPEIRPRQQDLSMSNKKIEKDLGIKMSAFDKALEEIKYQLSL